MKYYRSKIFQQRGGKYYNENKKDKKNKILQDDADKMSVQKKEIKKFNKDKIYYYGD